MKFLLIIIMQTHQISCLLSPSQISIPIITIDKVSIKVRETISFIYPR